MSTVTYSVQFSKPVYFTNYAGVNFYNVTQSIPGTGITSPLTQGETLIPYDVNWAVDPIYGDVVEFRYAGGDYGDLPVGDPERVLMENQTLKMVNCSVITFLTSNGDTFITSDGDTFTVGGA